MADINSGLPIRSQLPGQVNYDDLLVKIVDKTTSSQQLTVNPDGSVNITDNGGSITVDAVNLDIRDLVFATDKVDASGSVVALDAGTLAALESITVQNGAGGAAVNIQDGGNSITVDAVDLDIRNLVAATDSVAANLFDEAGAPFTDANPLPVYLANDPGTEVQSYNTAAAVAAGASSNHDYAVAAGSFELMQVHASSSGKLKIEIQQTTDGAAFTTLAVGFNSTANPNIDICFKAPYIRAGAASAAIRVIRTNKDGQSQDVYSTIVGLLK